MKKMPEIAQKSAPDLSTEHPLSTDQIQSFQRDGHLCIRNLISLDEVAVWRGMIRNAALQHNAETRKLEERDEYGKAFLQVGNLWQKDNSIRPFTFSKRFARAAADLMGVRSVRLYHDQALFKEPGGAATAWHQDQTYMPFETPNLIGLWVALVPVPLEVGSMSFVSGSHKFGWFGKFPFSAEADEPVQRIVREHDLRYTSYGTMEPGDATFHSAWTLHSAKGNPTVNVREIMNIFYLDGEAKVTKPMSPDHEIGLKYNLGESKIGGLPDERQNPIIYSKSGSLP